MFNDGKYWEKVQNGTLLAKLMANNHPSSPKAPVPACTKSQYLIYINNAGQKVAAVHQYLRPDGTLGASGRPDPKELLIHGNLYIPEN
jgi:hypothetical protein